MATNLSVVCVCQKVRGIVDDMNLPVGVSQQVVELMRYCCWGWYVLPCWYALDQRLGDVGGQCLPP